MQQRSYVVVTPVRDEAQHVGRTIESMCAQTVLPEQWVIVDDGSTDGTAEILGRHADKPWITVVCRSDRGHRASGGGVVEAFDAGLATLTCDGWAYLVKLDGDLSFDRDYFERCILAFEADPRLGIGGGAVYTMEADRLRIDSPGDPSFHVRGATKIYRRACWEQIRPLARAPGWDTIDEVKANHLGWRTRTLGDSIVVQHKPTGSADGRWRNWFKNGFANYMTGYHPLFMIAKCAKRAFRWPAFYESAALWAGFCSGYWRRVPPAIDVDAIRFFRKQQLRRLAGRQSIYG
jgi:glycosyltransferase involved in cell wall biosynthesis